MQTKPNREVSRIFPLRQSREYTDRDLVEGMVNRDPHATSAFFRAYGDQINKLVWKLLCSPDDHQDMVNTILVSIMRSIKKLKDPERLAQWVSKVTVNSVRDEIRKRQVRRRFFSNVEDPESHLPPFHAVAEDIDGRIFNILRTMKPESQIVFVLYYVEGYTFKEIAGLRDCSLSTVRRQGKRCKTEFLKKAARDLVLAGYIEDLNENDCI